MGRRTVDPFVTLFDDQQMPVRQTAIKPDVLIAQLVVEKNDELLGFFVREVSGRMTLQQFSLYTEQVTPNGQFVRL